MKNHIDNFTYIYLMGDLCMEVLHSFWLFIQDQVLGMKWLSVVIGKGLSTVGLVVLFDFYDFLYPELFSSGEE